MLNNKVLTVSVAAYNVQDYLAEALNSCLVDNSDLLEVIVVNDGSTDDTLAIARKFEKEYPSVFRVVDKENGGYGSTLNTALSMASGKYFRYLDGDDWFDRDVLNSFLGLLEKVDADAVYSPFVHIFMETGVERVEDRWASVAPDDSMMSIDDFPEQESPLACTWTFRTGMLRDSGFSMSERLYYSDTEYAIVPLANVRTIYVTHASLYRYRIGREGQSTSLDGWERHYCDCVQVAKNTLRKFDGLAFGNIAPGLAAKVVRVATVGYNAALLAKPSREAQRILKGYDLWLRGYSDIYHSAASSNRAVSLLRKTRFLAYWPLSVYKRWVERRKQS